MKITKDQIVMTKEQVKEIATNAAHKVVEAKNQMTAEDKVLCIAGAAVVIATLAALKVACIAKKTKKKLKDHEKRIAALEHNQIFED